jgi:hypothetical protein
MAGGPTRETGKAESVGDGGREVSVGSLVPWLLCHELMRASSIPEPIVHQ